MNFIIRVKYLPNVMYQTVHCLRPPTPAMYINALGFARQRVHEVKQGMWAHPDASSVPGTSVRLVLSQHEQVEHLRLRKLTKLSKWVLDVKRSVGWKRYRNGKAFAFSELSLVRSAARPQCRTEPIVTKVKTLAKSVKTGSPNGVTFLSWNCLNLSSKNAHKKNMQHFAEVVSTADFVALQEITDLGVLRDKLMPLLNKNKSQNWKLIQSQITGEHRRLECYAFIYRSDRVEVAGTKRDKTDLAYIVQQDNVVSALGWFHRPPMVATFRVINGFTFTAINTHVTYGGRKGYAPKGVEARKLELGNLAGLVAQVQEKHRVDRVLVMGDFNSTPPLQGESAVKNDGFSALVNLLSFKVCIDPTIWSSTMTSQCFENGGRRGRGRIPNPKLFDNILISEPMRAGGGLLLQECGVVDLRKMLPPDVETPRAYICETMSDHFPVFARFALVGGETKYDGPIQMSRVGMKTSVVRGQLLGAPYTPIVRTLH